jgi:hypothetical protein
MNQRNYTDIMDKMRTYSPSPVSNPVMDGYLVHTLSHFLDHIDDFKCNTRILGIDTDKKNAICSFHDVGKESVPMLPKKT